MWTQSPLQLLINQYQLKMIWVGVLGIPALWGSSLNISPIRVEISGPPLTSVITLENPGDTPRSYQIESYSWEQDEQQGDIYRETSDLVTVPPLFTLQPKQKQIVRIGIRKPAEKKEIAFRIFIQEIPVDHAPRDPETGIRTLLRVGIPVFVVPTTQHSRPQLVWSAEITNSEATSLVVENLAIRHIQMGRIRIGNDKVWNTSMYVLSGHRRRWTLPEPIPVSGNSIRLEVETDQGWLSHEARIFGK